MKAVFLGLLLAISSLVASAHEMRPSIASLSVDSQGVLKLELVTNMEAARELNHHYRYRRLAEFCDL